MNQSPHLTVIGRAEIITFPDYLAMPVSAKVDTGADTSSIWATDVRVEGARLQFKLLRAPHPAYAGKDIVLEESDYSVTRVANSFGHKELRYVVKLRIKVAGKLVNATFTLADRSQKTYPVLLGRKLLKNKFVVDVTRGDPLHTQEKAKRKKLELELEKLGGKLKEAS